MSDVLRDVGFQFLLRLGCIIWRYDRFVILVWCVMFMWVASPCLRVFAVSRFVMFCSLVVGVGICSVMYAF